MNQKNNNRPSAIGIRPRPTIRMLMEQIATEERRTLANVAVYIIDQYLSSTNGRLLKNIKIVPVEENRAA